MKAIRSIKAKVKNKIKTLGHWFSAAAKGPHGSGRGNGGGGSLSGRSGNEGPEAPPGREKPKHPKKPDGAHYNSASGTYPTAPTDPYYS
jgi:hypothetical protein